MINENYFKCRHILLLKYPPDSRSGRFRLYGDFDYLIQPSQWKEFAGHGRKRGIQLQAQIFLSARLVKLIAKYNGGQFYISANVWQNVWFLLGHNQFRGFRSQRK